MYIQISHLISFLSCLSFNTLKITPEHDVAITVLDSENETEVCLVRSNDFSLIRPSFSQSFRFDHMASNHFPKPVMAQRDCLTVSV